jgi:hypothetical protein
MEQACAAVSAEMERFFKEYERFANSADPGGITSLFSAEFMFGDPAGVRVVPTEGMAMAVAKRKRLFEGLGSRETRMVSLKTMELNDQYVLAEAEWAVEFAREDVREIRLRSWFVVQRAEEGPRIVFYLADENVMDVLRARGLLTAGSDPTHAR